MMTMTMLVMMLQVEDDDIRSDLEKIQPVPAIDTRATISPEQVDWITVCETLEIFFKL